MAGARGWGWLERAWPHYDFSLYSDVSALPSALLIPTQYMYMYLAAGVPPLVQ